MKLIATSLFLTTYNPLPPLFSPTNSSPIIKSLVEDEGPSIEPIVRPGDCGSFVSTDSYTPYTLLISGTFKQIS